jgi:hypothetical protein
MVADAGGPDAATIGTPEEIRNLPRTLPSPEDLVV